MCKFALFSRSLHLRFSGKEGIGKRPLSLPVGRCFWKASQTKVPLGLLLGLQIESPENAVGA